jgi:hypothetical protein
MKMFENVISVGRFFSEPMFWSGFCIMVLNETPVVLRHVWRPMMQFRIKMEQVFGTAWHKWHGWIDYLWNGLLFGGILLANKHTVWIYVFLFLGFWIPVFSMIYLPIFMKNKLGRGVPK